MVYRKAKQKVRRVYSRSKSILNSNIFKNPYAVGIVAGFVKNALTGKKIIDIENIKNRISKMDSTNPLIFLGIGILAKNPLLISIGLFGAVDPPDDAEKKEELPGYSNIGDIQENAEYSNIGDIQENAEYSNIGDIQKTQKKRCVF